MNYDEIRAEIEARIEHLSALRQPGPVDLGSEDNEQDQDTLFAELAALEAMMRLIPPWPLSFLPLSASPRCN